MLVDELELAPGRFWCLHVADHNTTKTPYGTITDPDPSQVESLHRMLSYRFKTDGINALLAGHANIQSVRRRFYRQPTVIDWLTQNSSLSSSDASMVIDGFPIRVAPLLCQNARNPLQFLGLAAAISKNPDVLVYSTSGMDPSGIEQIHKFAPAHYPNGCLIHVSTFPNGQSLLCPKSADCVVIEVNAETDDA